MNTEDLDISAETLEVIGGFAASIELIAKGGAAFKKKLDEIKKATAANVEAEKKANAAIDKAFKDTEDAKLLWQNVKNGQERAQKILDRADEVKNEQKAEKTALFQQANLNTKRSEELDARESSLIQKEAKLAADFEKREKALLEREARVDRVLSAASA